MEEFNVPRQIDAWPDGIDEAGKRWLADAVRLMLAGGPRPLDRIEDGVNSLARRQVDDSPEAYRTASIWDYRYACIERACREVAEKVWRLK